MTGRELMALLYGAGVIQFGNFELKMHEKYPDAPKSPILINLRLPPNGPLTEKIIRVVGIKLAQWVHGRIEFDYVTGLPKAGEPIAEELVRNWPGKNKPTLLYLEKREGKGKRKILPIIRGNNYIPGKKVLIIDDVLTIADTKIEAIKALRKKRLVVSDCIAVIDREQGGRKELAKFGVKLHSLFTLSELLMFYQMIDLIHPGIAKEVTGYQKQLDEYFAAKEEK